MRRVHVLAVLLAGCGGTLGDELTTAEERCDSNQPPDAPVVQTPFAGAKYLQPDEVVISASAFTDVDGDAMGGAQVEIWAVAPSGTLTTRVWSAAFDTMPQVVRLGDGAFDLDLEGLQPDTTYAAVVRYRDGRAPLGAKACATWGAWSAPQYFTMDNGSRAFFDDTQVQDIYLELTPEVIAALDAQARPPGCVPFERQYYPGNVIVGGQRFDHVGVKTKGGCGSSRGMGGKPSFKINLEWDDPAVPGCPDKRRYNGQRSLTINNGVQDRTAGHERVAYAFFHALGVGSSRAASVRMNVNGQYWGVYQLLETVERPMLKRWYGSGGMLYEGTYWCDVSANNLPIGDADNKCLTREFHPTECDGTPDPGDDPITYDPLRDLVAKLDAIPPGGFLPAARDFLDVDEFLSDWAGASVLGHWDSYELNIVNNYRIYHDPQSHLWHFLPSGLDQTMGSDVDPFNPQGRVAKLCLQNQECKALFAARLREAAATFEAMDLVDRAKAIHDQLLPHVMADPRKEYSMGTWESENTNWRNWIAARPAQIRQKLAAAGFPAP